MRLMKEFRLSGGIKLPRLCRHYGMKVQSMNRSKQTLRLTLTALLMSMNIVFSFSALTIPTPVGNIYFCNAVINVAAVLVDPLAAFVVGGVGSFIGDLLTYPAAMFVSLVAHGAQALLVSLFSRRLTQMKLPLRCLTAMAVGSAAELAGYTLGRALIYGQKTWHYAVAVKLPIELLQVGIGIALAMLLLFPLGILDSFHREIGEPFGVHGAKRSGKR